MFYFTSLTNFFQTKKLFFALFLVLSFAFLVYLQTLAPSYTWQHWGSDAGDLIASVYNWGIPHPPGTPIYVLLAQPFRLLPFGDPAFKMNFASSIFSFLALLVLFLTVYQLTSSLTASSLSVLFLAFSPVFWSQSIITEVYTLHVLLTGLVIYFLIRWAASPNPPPTTHHLYLALFFFGLSLSNHTSSLMLFPAILYLVLAMKGRKILHLSCLLPVACCLLLGLLPYLYLPLRARVYPPLNWGDPKTLDRFIAHISGREYGQMLFYKSQRFVADSIINFLLSLFKNFNFLGVSLAALGLAFGFVKKRILLNFSVFVFLFQLLFNANYKIPNIETFYLPSFFIFSLWTGLGTAEVLSFLGKFKNILSKKWSVILISLEFPSVLGGKTWNWPLADFLIFCLTLSLSSGPFFNLFQFWHEVDLSSDFEAVVYGEGVFKRLEKNAIVITEGDKFTLVLDYYRWVVHKNRVDVAVFPNGIYLQDWRLKNARRLYPWVEFPDLPLARDGKEAMACLLILIEANFRKYPVYLTLDYPPPKEEIATRTQINGFIIQSFGPIYKVLGKAEEG